MADPEPKKSWAIEYMEKIEKLRDQKLRERGIDPATIPEQESTFDFEHSKIKQFMDKVEKLAEEKRNANTTK